MKGIRTRISIFLILSLLAVSVLGISQGAPAPLGIIPTPIPTPQPLEVTIWTDKASYVIGENVTIFFNVTQPSFIYIYDIQPDGLVRLIFPNAYSQSNYVSAGMHTLPDGLYKFTVAPPAGVEQLQIFASPTQLQLAPQSYGEPFPLIGQDPESASGQIQGHIMGITPEPIWATAWASFTIIGQSYGYTPPTTPTYPPGYGYYPPSYSPYPFPYPPFYGVPGGTWYWQDGQWHYGLPGSGWYWYFGTDGKWHFRIQIRIGTGG